MTHRYALILGALLVGGMLAGGVRPMTAHVWGTAEEGEEQPNDQNDAGPGAFPDEGSPLDMTVQVSSGQRLRVVASTSIVGDVVSNLGGDHIELTVLMAYGQDPHGFELTPESLVSVERAHIVFVNGLGLEGGLLKAIQVTAKDRVIPVSIGITPLDVVEQPNHRAGPDDHPHDLGDPHVWMDPGNVAVWVENITRVLTHADPANQESYTAAALVYRGKLLSLDGWMRERFSAVPVAKRRVVTDHQILGYLAHAYNFKVIGTVLPATSTSADPSARQIADLVEILRREGVRAILVGATAGKGLQDLAHTVAQELGQGVQIVPLLTGSLAPKGQPGDTYLGYMEYNTNQILKALRVAH